MRAHLKAVTHAITLIAVLAARAAPAAEAGWRQSPLWDDGQAEYCAYEVDWRRYGTSYPGRALLITVKEPWAPDLEVKADRPRADGFDVLKLNHVREVQTGIYAYNQMASVFLRRDSGELRKLAATSSEGCGISTARMTDGTLATSSYFDGQGEGSASWPDGAIPEDGLPASLRDFVPGEAPATLRVFPSLMAGRFPRLEAAEMSLSRRAGVTVETPAGSFSTVELRLEGGRSGGSYFFEAEAPHKLVKLERADGTTYRLAKCERIPYWRMAGPGGESWLPDSLR